MRKKKPCRKQKQELSELHAKLGKLLIGLEDAKREMDAGQITERPLPAMLQWHLIAWLH